ncbi:hypothetical protein [Streptomyces sp. NPDC088360]|uniref:hypothetical protein n=1 Tax=Streptomyces sp. NPDC088360 TaxID=3154515 RepID=UPI00344F3059
MRKRTARGMCGSAAGLAAGLALVVMGAPQAVAGGPTSVLVVSPESGQSTALYVSDKEYGELERCLGDIGEGRREQPPGLDLSAGSRQINVTWMAHDVSPWRVDRAYPMASGSKEGKEGKDATGAKSAKDAETVWIHTTTDVESMTGSWHKAKDPARLTALFKKLGVMGAAAARGNQATAPETDAAPPPTTASARADGIPGDGGTDWWWAIPGAAAGAAVALLLRGPFLASLRGRRLHEDGPRQELRDV